MCHEARIAAFLPFVAVLVVVGVRGVTAAAAPARGTAPSEALQREMARDVLRFEAADRHRAVRAFPGDAWSQGDAYHGREAQRVRVLARRHEVAVADVLASVDRALREQWFPQLETSAEVAPCKPRPFYD